MGKPIGKKKLQRWKLLLELMDPKEVLLRHGFQETDRGDASLFVPKEITGKIPIRIPLYYYRANRNVMTSCTVSRTTWKHEPPESTFCVKAEHFKDLIISLQLLEEEKA